METNDVLFKLRGAVVLRAYRDGVRLLHRPPDIRFDEKRAVLMPDLLEEPNSNLRVGDCVTVNINRLHPWLPTDSVSLESSGFTDGAYMDSGSKKPYVFRLLCFARASAKKACTFEGTFAVIEVDSFLKFGSVYSASQEKVALHWVGCLERKE